MVPREDLIAIANGGPELAARLISRRAQFGPAPAGMLKLSFVKIAAPGDWWDPGGYVSAAGNQIAGSYDQLAQRAGQNFSEAAQGQTFQDLAKTWNDHPMLQAGVYGAGVGGLLGLGSGLIGKKKRPLSNLLTGALLGAGVGTGGRFLYDKFQPEAKPTVDAEAERRGQLAAGFRADAQGQAPQGQGGAPAGGITPTGGIKLPPEPTLKEKLPQLAAGVRAEQVERLRQANFQEKGRWAIDAKQKAMRGEPPPPPFVPKGDPSLGISDEEAGQTPTRPITGPIDAVGSLGREAAQAVGAVPPDKDPGNTPAPEDLQYAEPGHAEILNHPGYRGLIQDLAATAGAKRVWDMSRGFAQGWRTPWRGKIDPRKDMDFGFLSKLRSGLGGAGRSLAAAIPGPLGRSWAGRFHPGLRDVAKTMDTALDPSKFGPNGAPLGVNLDLLPKGSGSALKNQATWLGQQNQAKNMPEREKLLSTETGLAETQKAYRALPFRSKFMNWGYRTGVPYGGAMLAAALDPNTNRETWLDNSGTWARAGWGGAKAIGSGIGSAGMSAGRKLGDIFNPTPPPTGQGITPHVTPPFDPTGGAADKTVRRALSGGMP